MGWLKDWKANKSQHKKIYDQFSKDIQDQSCWICGRTVRDQPAYWYAPWIIQRCHIVNKPRLEDRRVVVAACQICHERYDGKDHDMPAIETGHLIWIKQKIDPDFFDLDLLQKCSVKIIPEPIRPDFGIWQKGGIEV